MKLKKKIPVIDQTDKLGFGVESLEEIFVQKL